MKKGYVLLLLVAMLTLFIVGCSTDKGEPPKAGDNDYAKAIQSDLEVFSGGDISAITENVFGVASDEATTDGAGNGVIADLFANAEVQITHTDESTISYTIASPDISDFFTAYADRLDSITTSEELGQAILEYAETAPMKEYTVTIPYSASEDGIDVSYNDPNFINAMTGGLLEAYSELYEQYLTEEG